MNDIGRYRIIGELGRGGMGVVYRAVDPVLGREVAIKTLKLSDLADPSEREALHERLAREARAAAALSHPGIVAIHDVVFQQDEQGDLISLVMERIEGYNLASVPPPDLMTALRIIYESAAALDYAHRKGIVHRDIKPANLMIDESGSVKIADFGIAKITSSQTRTDSNRGMVVGTAGYMSPEQLRGDPIDGRADQFSLAVVAYEMLAHRRPFMADSLIALTHQVVFESAPALSTIRPGLGPAVDAVFQRALSKSPDSRFVTCSEFAAALDSEACEALNVPTANQPVYRPITGGQPLLRPTTGSQPATVQPTFAHPPTYTQAPAPPTTRRQKSFTARYWPIASLLAGVATIGSYGAYTLRQGSHTQPPAPQIAAGAKTAPLAVDPKATTTTAPKPAAALNAVPVRLNKKDEQKYVEIPAGTFTMGCIPNDEDCGAFAKPAHRVTLTNGFWMAQTETTVAAFQAFSAATQRAIPKAPPFNPNWTLTDHPMVETTWDDANDYCAWAGARLPTEAEWEYAARAGSVGTVFPWGNEPSHELANYGVGSAGAEEDGASAGKDQWLNTSPVASFPPNAFHLYDMVGNAAEWCADWFSQKYYATSPATDPKGPPTGAFRLIRGGSWKSPPQLLHISFRGNRKPQDHGQVTGFRCVATPSALR